MKTLTSGEIASYCDVNLRTVIRWIESGKLKGFKLPGRGNNRVLAGIMLSQYEPKVMTLDLSMPGMDGYSVIEFTRDQSKYKDLKIVVISALDEISLERALEIGADATLQKPFSNHDLTMVLEQFMSM